MLGGITSASVGNMFQNKLSRMKMLNQTNNFSPIYWLVTTVRCTESWSEKAVVRSLLYGQMVRSYSMVRWSDLTLWSDVATVVLVVPFFYSHVVNHVKYSLSFKNSQVTLDLTASE